jgi:hypothetical protein
VLLLLVVGVIMQVNSSETDPSADTAPALPDEANEEVLSMVFHGLMGGIALCALRVLAKASRGMSLVDTANQTARRWRLPPVMMEVGREESPPRERDPDAIFFPQSVIDNPRRIRWRADRATI